MKKIILTLSILISISFSKEDVRKSSELELFLFKVGFQSLLSDVDLTKEKVSLNESEIIEIKEKLSLLIKQLSNDNIISNENTFSQEVYYKREIESLKKEIEELKESVNIETIKVPKTTIKIDSYKEAFVNSNNLYVREKPFNKARLINKLKRNSLIKVKCNKYSWCKLASKEGYVKSFYLSFK